MPRPPRPLTRPMAAPRTAIEARRTAARLNALALARTRNADDDEGLIEELRRGIEEGTWSREEAADLLTRRGIDPSRLDGRARPAPTATPRPRATARPTTTRRTFADIAGEYYRAAEQAHYRPRGWSEDVAPAATTTTRARSVADLARAQWSPARDYRGRIVTGGAR